MATCAPRPTARWRSTKCTAALKRSGMPRASAVSAMAVAVDMISTRRLGPEPLRVDRVPPDLVVDDPLGGVEQPRGLRAVASGRLERVLNQILLVARDRVLQRHARHRP